jgi:membrane fusion protein, multidrug efflux system
MRVVSQLAVIVVIAGAGYGAWTYREPIMALWSAPSANAVTQPAQGQQGPRPTQVVVKTVRVGPIEEVVEAVGTTLANESIVLTSKVTGIVKDLNFNDGQEVKAGHLLVQLDDRETLAELEQSRATRDQARQTLARSRALLEQRATPVARVEEQEQLLRAAEARVRMVEAKLKDLQIVAPFDGRVGIRRISPGALVTANAQTTSPITTLDDTSIVKLRFNIPETALSALQVGSSVAAQSSAYQGRSFQGRVAVIDTRIDPATRSVEVRADIPNADGLLKPGMFMTVQLVVGRREQALLVPEEALVPEGTRQFVFVVANGRAVKTEVRLGNRIPGEAEVVQGLAPGAVVVTGGVQRIRDGSPVRPADAPSS